MEDVRAALASANANSPKGSIDTASLHYQLYSNDQATRAADYKPLVIAYRNNAAVRLSDVADVLDSVENIRHAGISQGKPAVLAIVFRQPGANIIDTVDGDKGGDPAIVGGHAKGHRFANRHGPHTYDPRQSARNRNNLTYCGRLW